MANNRIYANFLMHGRTKGSRNGISTTKGYTAVGQKAKGKIINGRWYYNITPDYVKAENAAKVKARNYAKSHGYDWGENTFNYVTNPDIKSQNAANVKARAAAIDKKYGYKQMASQAASQEWRDKQERAESEAKKKMYSQAANAERDTLAKRNSVAKGAANNWQQQAAAARDNKETYTKYKEGKISAITAKDNSGDVTTMYHPKDQYGVNYTAIKTEKLGAASKGKKNNWQQAGNLTRSMTEVARDLRNREAAREAAVKKMKSKQPNAMNGDPRYSIQYPKRTFEEMEAAAARENPAYANAMKLRNQPETFMGKKVTTLLLEDAKAESKKRNSRSDIGNAVADFKEEAKAKAKSLFKKKKKK